MTTLQQFVRKSLIQITATFTPVSGSAVPNTANCELQFNDLTGAPQTAAVPLSLSNGVWTGGWDSTAAGQCTVSWVVYCAGGVQASAQGQFQIVANAANVV